MKDLLLGLAFIVTGVGLATWTKKNISNRTFDAAAKIIEEKAKEQELEYLKSVKGKS